MAKIEKQVKETFLLELDADEAAALLLLTRCVAGSREKTWRGKTDAISRTLEQWISLTLQLDYNLEVELAKGSIVAGAGKIPYSVHEVRH